MIFRTSAIKTFWLSLQFFSQLPTPQYVQISTREMAAAMAWAPIVGLILGLGLAMLLASAQALYSLGFSAGVFAGFILLFWVGFSKGLHLDGVADFGDAWMGAFGNKQRALRIMKDSRLGTGGVIALVVLLLLKWQLLQSILSLPALSAFGLLGLLLIPAFARFMVLRLMIDLPYVGLSRHHRHLFRYWHFPVNRRYLSTVWWVCSALFMLVMGSVMALHLQALPNALEWVLFISLGLALILFMCYVYLVSLFNKLIAGVNGDFIGFSIEIFEMIGLLLLLMLLQGWHFLVF